MTVCRRASLLVALLALFASRRAFAWGPDGHQTVATIAEKLLAGTHAGREVHKILGKVSLADAAVWADCVKAVSPPPELKYRKDPQHAPECAPFETAAGEAAMIDFVKRNATNCNPKPTEEICHKQYHYTDIASQHESYKPTYVGARADDVTAAITAAIAVLRGAPAPAPFSIKSKREALLILVHYVGDLHQPLHVGAVYLDAAGKLVDPDHGPFDPATDTRGGNLIAVSGPEKNLHRKWDDVPDDLKPGAVNAQWLAEARAVPYTPLPIVHWSTTWASDTQKQARKAFAGLEFGARSDQGWSVKFPAGYSQSMNAIKRAQLTKAGARLARLLDALWPDIMPASP
ncbi:MAG TPA: S1/P1 nuclease [Polyangia bacterium]|jgi:hypothetical protein